MIIALKYIFTKGLRYEKVKGVMESFIYTMDGKNRLLSCNFICITMVIWVS